MKPTAEEAWQLSVELNGLIVAIQMLAFEFDKEGSRERHALFSTINAALTLSDFLDSKLNELIVGEAAGNA